MKWVGKWEFSLAWRVAIWRLGPLVAQLVPARSDASKSRQTCTSCEYIWKCSVIMWRQKNVENLQTDCNKIALFLSRLKNWISTMRVPHKLKVWVMNTSTWSHWAWSTLALPRSKVFPSCQNSSGWNLVITELAMASVLSKTVPCCHISTSATIKSKISKPSSHWY